MDPYPSSDGTFGATSKQPLLKSLTIMTSSILINLLAFT